MVMALKTGYITGVAQMSQKFVDFTNYSKKKE
jgi:hypothetical protein